MPIYEYMLKTGRKVEEIFPYPPPRRICVDGMEGRLVPSAAAFRIEDGTEKFFAAQGKRIVEPGMDKDVERNRRYREEAEDRRRKQELEQIFPEVMDELGAN